MNLITCDICGTLNFKENNYCTHCGNKLVIDRVCPICGESNTDLATHCVKCNSQLNPIVIDDFDILFSEFNQNLLANARIDDEDYMELLSNIFVKADFADVWGEDAKNKIINIANIFTECRPKSRGYERGYIHLGKYIFYDDRLEDSVQISTIIHELAHYFMFNIIETLICHILRVRSSSTIQSFIWYFLNLFEFKIMSEYCAHTVEGRFIPYGYQNYGSFNALVENSAMDEESLQTTIMLGNSFANEIIVYLEKYIDEDLRNDIKMQYRKDLTPPTNQSIVLETNDCFSVSSKNEILINVILNVLKDVSDNKEAIKELESIKEDI